MGIVNVHFSKPEIWLANRETSREMWIKFLEKCAPDVIYWYCINFRREFDMEGKPKTTESLLGKDDPLQENTVTQKNSDDKTNFGLR